MLHVVTVTGGTEGELGRETEHLPAAAVGPSQGLRGGNAPEIEQIAALVEVQQGIAAGVGGAGRIFEVLRVRPYHVRHTASHPVGMASVMQENAMRGGFQALESGPVRGPQHELRS